MSEAWYAAFGLLVVLCLANTVILIGVLRQVGVLHQRVRPIGPGTLEGPVPGDLVPQLPLTPVNGDPTAMPFASSITLLGYVRPGCGLCEDLPGMFRAYLKSAGPELDISGALVTDAAPDEAAVLSRRLKLDQGLPLLRYPQLGKTYEVPGSPYVFALRPEEGDVARILACGVINELEQLELLVDNALSYEEPGARVPSGQPALSTSGPSAFSLRKTETRSGESGDQTITPVAVTSKRKAERGAVQ